MTRDDVVLTKLRKVCLSFPDTKETLTWDKPHFRVGEKIFAGYGEENGRATIGFKLKKEHAAHLVENDLRFHRAPYVGHAGWVSMDTAGVTDWDELELLLRESYSLIAPKKNAALIAPPSEQAGASRKKTAPKKATKRAKKAVKKPAKRSRAKR